MLPSSVPICFAFKWCEEKRQFISLDLGELIIILVSDINYSLRLEFTLALYADRIA